MCTANATPASSLPPTVLAVVDTDTASLPAWLSACGMAPAALGTLATLAHQLSALAPQQVVLHLERDLPALADWLTQHSQHARLPAPFTLVSAAQHSAAVVQLTQAGLHGWVDAASLPSPQAPNTPHTPHTPNTPHTPHASPLPLLLQLAHARWQREHQREAELARLREQLDERKWVERAKGVLMSARAGSAPMNEEEAFRLLRGAAMHANLRVGEVSRSVIEAAQWAEAVNRAGQLRMLSQRLVKLAAQRLAGVDARRARTLQHQASQRAQDNLSHLAALPPLAQGAPALRSALAATEQSWQALKTALELRQSTAALLATDACATQLLHTADTLTDALEGHGARRALHIVNLCGRQRMRAQRLAKTALLQDLASAAGTAPTQPGPVLASNAPDLVAQLDEFELALLELERAPLSTPDTRALLAQARDEWLRLLRGLRAGGSDEGRAALAGSADALLDVFEQLTAVYEHSLQVLMA